MTDKLFDNSGNQIGEVRHNNGIGITGWLAIFAFAIAAWKDIKYYKTKKEYIKYCRDNNLPEPVFEFHLPILVYMILIVFDIGLLATAIGSDFPVSLISFILAIFIGFIICKCMAKDSQWFPDN